MPILKSFYIFILFTSFMHAKTPEEETAEKIYLANINALLIFTSESGLSSGNYNFTKAGFEMQTYTLPFRYHFKPVNEKMNFFVNGGVGYSITRLTSQTIDPRSANNIELTHDNKLQTYTGGLGIGLRYKSDIGIDYLASFGFIYSRVGLSVTPDDEIKDAIEDFFDQEYNDNITYKFHIGAEYQKNIQGYKPYLKFNFKSYETKANFTFDALAGFTTQSRVSSLALGAETPSLLKHNENFISLEGYLKVNYLLGDIKDVVGFERYMNIGAIVYYNTPKAPSWMKRFYTEVSTVRAEGLEGYNIGIGFSFDY